MIPIVISLGFSFLYIFMQTFSIYAGDSGELVTAAYTWGIAHPPGYPLYTFLGGIIAHTFSLYTAAWRVGLLSSIPMAISLYFLWNIILRITHSKVGATIGVLCYGFLYPVWLYGIVPEVFGLFSLFSAVLLYLFILFLETNKSCSIFFFAFISGLSLTHHHLILLLFLSIGISIGISYKKIVLLQLKNLWKYAAFFFLGLSFYLYAPLASSQYPALDWEHPASPMGFLRLITRASYGTFKASYGAGETLVDRGLNLLTFGEYSLKDFTVFGIVFFFIGLFWLWKRNRPYALFFLIYLSWQLFYFFYAGYRLTSDFALGTLERFFIIPYQIIAILVGVGVWGFLEFLERVWQTHKKDIHIPFVYIQILVVLTALVIPLGSIKHNFVALHALRNDLTLEKLADDIFASTPPGAILNVSDDTSVFAVLYGYYVQKKRPDIRLILFPQFQYSYYPAWLKHHYTDIAIPPTPRVVSYREYLKLFLDANAPIRPIVSERADAVVPNYWVPHGVLVTYAPTFEDIPSQEQILEINRLLWDTFQDPLSGIIGIYKHMMLSDVLRYYAGKRLTLAQALLQAGKTDEAQVQASEAIRLTPNRLELFVSYIEDLIKEKKCSEAVTILDQITNVYVNQQFYLELHHRLYATCPDFQSQLQSFENEYQNSSTKSATRIE